MKKLTQLTSALGLCLLLTSAQATFAQNGVGATGNTTTTTNDQRDDDGPDLGWLGLLGLAGLAGLMKKPERHVVHQTDLPRTSSTGTTDSTIR